MTNYSKRVFEMLVRVVVFWSTYKDAIAKDSRVDQHFQEVQAALDKISTQDTMQRSGKNGVRVSSAGRRAAREQLREELEILCSTADSMGLNQLFMPRDKGDRSLASVTRVFLPIVEPLKAEFVANHLPEDFIERLKTSVETIERSIEQQGASKSVRKIATATISEAQADALGALSRVDPIMDNLLRGNEPVKIAWYAARRVEKAPASKKAANPPQPTTPPLASAATSAA